MLAIQHTTVLWLCVRSSVCLSVTSNNSTKMAKRRFTTVDRTSAMMTVLCTTVVHSDLHTREQFLNLRVGLGLDFVFVCLFTFSNSRVFLC